MPIEILMPALSPTMTQGNLAKWLKKEGDIVKSGQVIAEIETDKATMEVEAVDEGVIGKILVPAGAQDVPVNAAIAVLLLEGEDKKILENYVVKAEVKQAASPAPAASNQDTTPKIDNSKILPPAPKPDSVVQISPQPNISSSSISSNNVVSIQTTGALPYAAKDVKASPLARRLAGAYQLDLSAVNGSGPRGRIVRADVEAAKSAATSNRIVRQTNEVTAVPNNNMRKVIAKRLLESKQYVPHFYLSIDCVIDKLLDVRKDLNDAAPLNDGKPAYKISVNDMVIKAVAKALKQVPAANASWTDEAILLYNNVDVAVAVAIDGGLITPIVKNAEQKSLVNITTEMKDLAARARLGKLSPHEFQGGGFSISNLGMYGIKNFNAIINPPQSCILAVGASQMQPVVEDGKIVVRNIMNCTLSCDHRVVDGAVGAEFLTAFRNFIEHPVLLVV